MPYEKQLNRIELKLEKVDDRLGDIDRRLAKYNAELEIHVKRTSQIEVELMPIAKTYERWIGASVLLGIIATLAGVLGAVAWLWS